MISRPSGKVNVVWIIELNEIEKESAAVVAEIFSSATEKISAHQLEDHLSVTTHVSPTLEYCSSGDGWGNIP